MNNTLLYDMEYSIPIPRGKSGIGMEWNGMEFGIFHVEWTSKHPTPATATNTLRTNNNTKSTININNGVRRRPPQLIGDTSREVVDGC